LGLFLATFGQNSSIVYRQSTFGYVSNSKSRAGFAQLGIEAKMEKLGVAPAMTTSPKVSVPVARKSRRPALDAANNLQPSGGVDMEAKDLHIWFGNNLVLEKVNLSFASNSVTALIGPSGCGKSTFIRTLNRMHELIPTAALAGEVLLNGKDIYAPGTDVTQIRLKIGMVFQKPNPFPAMTIYDNVLSGLRLAKLNSPDKDDLVEECLTKAGLWTEVKDRLGAHAISLSGGQQQRLCIARALAVRPSVLLMDEPCSALDPGSTLRIEDTINELSDSITIIIVTHNMQQAARVSDYTAFFLAEYGESGRVIEFASTEDIFSRPKDNRTENYISGRFG
jgi:phosphate transport system ATP-binding protein